LLEDRGGGSAPSPRIFFSSAKADRLLETLHAVDDLQHELAAAGLAAVLPVILRWLNPDDVAFGNKGE
jgi:hypothetical protein